MLVKKLPILEHNNFAIDPNCRLVTLEGEKIELPPKEFDILYLFAQHPGWVFTKNQIYEYLYKKDISVNIENAIYCLIYNLRNKIEKDPRHPTHIVTVRSIGYKFIV